MLLTTLCFLLRDGQVCLALKKRGFGAGKWNGAGGKVEAGETVRAAAVELKEEIGVEAREDDLRHMGIMHFSSPGNPDGEMIKMHIFTLAVWQGEPTQSDEMAPRWFSADALPFHAMWVSDTHWLPQVLKGIPMRGVFSLSADGLRVEAASTEPNAILAV